MKALLLTAAILLFNYPSAAQNAYAPSAHSEGFVPVQMVITAEQFHSAEAAPSSAADVKIFQHQSPLL